MVDFGEVIDKFGMDALKGRRLIGQKELTCVFGLLCGERSSEQRINRSTDHESPAESPDLLSERAKNDKSAHGLLVC